MAMASHDVAASLSPRNSVPAKTPVSVIT